MKKITSFKLLLFIVAVVGTLSGSAQMLEQIDMSSPSGNANTYVTGLNNSGYITGYYNSGGNDTGFIITDRGTILKVSPVFFGADDVKVESINDYGVAVVTATTGTNVNIWKIYVDTVSEYIADFQPVTGIVQASSVAFDINNKHDISGWFQSSTRFLFVKHDSIVPTGNSGYESDRFETPGPTYYNTMAGGINDANKVVGFYIDGSNNVPYVYDNITEVFDELAIAEKTKLWDINNNGWVAGEYQTAGVWTAFIANASTGNFSNFTSLSSIFETTTPAIQSVANAINDNGVVAGSFLHPTTGKWTGFLYFPEITEYRLPSFNFEDDTWKMENHLMGTNPVWTSGYWAGTDHVNNDPYANNGIPLLDANIMATHQLTTIGPEMNPKWKAFATEFDGAQTGLSSDPNTQNAYQTIIKPKMFDVWHPFVHPGGFLGSCYGFTNITLLRHYYDNLFSSWYGIPAGTNISQIPNSDYNAIEAIERMLSKQHDPTVATVESVHKSTWGGLYRLKCTFQKNFYDTNPRGLNIKFGTAQWHSVLPYKIRTPRMLPISDAKDTVFIYDSNYPDSTEYIAVSNNEMYPAGLYIYATSYVLSGFNFSSCGIRFLSTEQYSELNKSTSGLAYHAKTSIGLHRFCDYVMRHNGNLAAELSNGSYYRDSLVVSPMYKYNSGQHPYKHLVDSSKSFDITTSNYTDNAMVWLQLNGPRNMGLSRQAQPTQTDHSTQKTGMITYGNPDNTTKYLTGFLRENATDLLQGVNITAKNICADQGDSIVTQTPASYMYNITKVNGNSTCTYELDVYASYNGEIIEFHSPIELDPNTSHTIDPYFVGSNGTQIAVIVDNGLDGTTDDTLFVAGFPLGVGQVIDKGGIRIYPNPVQDELNVEFSKAGKYSIVITDVVGRMVSNNNLSVSAGRTTLPMGQYPAGMYLIQVADEKGNILLKDKIIKQ